MHQRFAESFSKFFPAGTQRKRRALGLCLLALASAPAGAQAPGRLVIPRAARVEIGHVGIHTHANFILFDTGAHDLAVMQADPAHFPRLTLKAHSRLPTDRAALPPGLAMPGDPPLDNPYGAMDGGTKGQGWGVIPLHQGGRNTARVVVPTRFANWVALQPLARRKAYGDPRWYWLEARWEPTPRPPSQSSSGLFTFPFRGRVQSRQGRHLCRGGFPTAWVQPPHQTLTRRETMMERRPLGKTGLEVSALGFGGAEIGYQSAALETVERLLGSALDAGLNVIDTAECYMISEELIGKSVGHRRDAFHLFTKCGHASGLPGEDWDPQMLRASIDRSLQRLGTDRVDLVQLHSCDEAKLRQGDLIAVLQEARDAGKTRLIGYSGDHEAARYAVECGAFDTLQTSVSIADQEPITLTLPLALEKGMGVIAKRPLANVAWTKETLPESEYAFPYFKRLQSLAYDFLSGPEAASIALRFTLAQPAVSTAIVGTQNPDRWLANARLLDAGPLPPAQVEAIRARWNEVAGEDWTGQG